MIKNKVQRVTQVLVDTTKSISELGIQIPRVEYKVSANVTTDMVFTGKITPLPTVLVHFLRPDELRYFSVVMEEILERGECILNTKQFSLKMSVSKPTVYECKRNLLKMGLLNEEKLSGNRRRLSVNWLAVNILDDLVDGEDNAIMSRIRKATQKVKIENMTRKDIERAYDERVLPPDHDPREEEIYD